MNYKNAKIIAVIENVLIENEDNKDQSPIMMPRCSSCHEILTYHARYHACDKAKQDTSSADDKEGQRNLYHRYHTLKILSAEQEKQIVNLLNKLRELKENHEQLHQKFNALEASKCVGCNISYEEIKNLRQSLVNMHEEASHISKKHKDALGKIELLQNENNNLHAHVRSLAERGREGMLVNQVRKLEDCNYDQARTVNILKQQIDSLQKKHNREGASKFPYKCPICLGDKSVWVDISKLDAAIVSSLPIAQIRILASHTEALVNCSSCKNGLVWQ